jgi:hypothetical protein
MGKSSLFVGWAALLGLSLYFAWATRELRGDGRDPVAAVQKASGSVYQRPAAISVYEEVAVGDSLFNDDYISTGARSSVELVLFSGKTLVISENSLVHLTFNVDEAGFGSDIVTLLKGDMLARGGGAVAGARRSTSTKFKIGKNSVSDEDGDSDIRISKKVDEAEAVVKVVSGSARILDAEGKVQEVANNDIVKLASAAPVMKPLAVNPVMNLAAAKMPVIRVAPQSIMADDKLIATLPMTLKKVNLASIKTIETPPPPSAVPEKVPAKVEQAETEPEPEVAPEPVKKPQQVSKKPPQKIKVAAVSPQAPPPAVPYTVVLRSANPAAFAGPGIYLVRNQSLFAKVTGKPTTENLLSLKKQYGGQFFFQGNAQAFSGKASLKALEGQSTVYAVSAKGIQPIDARLIMSRPVALDLLVDGGYSIFKEKVDLINVGH